MTSVSRDKDANCFGLVDQEAFEDNKTTAVKIYMVLVSDNQISAITKSSL